jgi:hypothetical protein
MTPTAARKRVGAAAVGALAVYTSVLRPRIQWLGTSNEERTAAYPGDDLVPGGRRYGAMATTIAAPPECVWPWLVQLGCDRAGFYSFDACGVRLRGLDQWVGASSRGGVSRLPFVAKTAGSGSFSVGLMV